MSRVGQDHSFAASLNHHTSLALSTLPPRQAFGIYHFFSNDYVAEGVSFLRALRMLQVWQAYHHF